MARTFCFCFCLLKSLVRTEWCLLFFFFFLNILTYQAFTTISIFNSMRFCLALLPPTVKNMADASVSLKRLRVNCVFHLLLNYDI